MSFRNELGMLAVSMMLVGGCDKGAPTDLDNADTSIKVCNSDTSCMSPNCDDINQPNQGVGSDFSIRFPKVSAFRYKLTGFFQEGTSWRVRGFIVNQTTKEHRSADGWVKGAIVGGVNSPIVSMRADTTRFEMTVCTIPSTSCPITNQMTLSGNLLEGNTIVVQLPTVTEEGRDARPVNYNLTFNSPREVLDLVKPNSPEVYGFQFTYESSDQVSIPKTTLCAGPGSVAQRTFFYQTAYWDPKSFEKTTNAQSITVSCEYGAIAACMSWGYKPWEFAKYNGASVSKDEWHATCVNAKTANYCGNGTSWTRFGTEITVNDPLIKPVMSEKIDYLEARWSKLGAVCVNSKNARIPSLMFSSQSCMVTMPDCDWFDTQNVNGATFLNTGIPFANP